MYEYRCSVLRVVDADTLQLSVDLGCDVRISLTIRLDGLDAPELKTPEGKAAKLVTDEWVKAAGDTLTLKTIKDKREKFGRYLGVLFRANDAQSLNAWLLASGNAKPYSGGAR